MLRLFRSVSSISIKKGIPMIRYRTGDSTGRWSISKRLYTPGSMVAKSYGPLGCQEDLSDAAPGFGSTYPTNVPTEEHTRGAHASMRDRSAQAISPAQ